jgi:hypothetical protein
MNPSEKDIQRVTRALRKLERSWPKGLWLFATGNGLSLMREHADGSRHNRTGGMDQDLEIASFNIKNDGGDWG